MWSDGVLVGFFRTSGMGWWCSSIGIFWPSGVWWCCYGIGHLKGISFDHNMNNKGDILCVHHIDTWYRMYNIVHHVQSIICKASR